MCFSIGIILIMIYKWNLFTGYVPNIKKFNFKNIIYNPLIIFIGNIIGTSIIGFISHFLPKVQYDMHHKNTLRNITQYIKIKYEISNF